MAVEKLWTCDGCVATTVTQIDDQTSQFFSIRVTAGAWGGDFHLCTKCHSRLLDNIDPTKWPRYAVAAAA
jgi:hypothetical protein